MGSGRLRVICAESRYILKYILILKSFAIYGLDVFTATTMILSDHVRALLGG